MKMMRIITAAIPPSHKPSWDLSSSSLLLLLGLDDVSLSFESESESEDTPPVGLTLAVEPEVEAGVD